MVDIDAKNRSLAKRLLNTPQFTEEDIKLYKETIAPTGTPEAQIKLAFFYAMKLGLDPLRKQIMITKTGTGERQQYMIIVGIHGMTALIERHKEYRGIYSAAVYPGEDVIIDSLGNVKHEFKPLERANKLLPIGAWATCARWLGDHTHKSTIYLNYKDYVNQYSTSWQKQPGWMIDKTARAFAMRAAFADILSGVYAPEEFGERSLESEEMDLPTRIP